MMWHIRRTLSFLSGWSGVCRCRTGKQPSRTSSSSSGSLFMTSDSSSTGMVLHSQSTDVYQNLALEDWIDANVDLQQRSILLLWRNQPAVVIGRHQNPWTECSLPAMRRLGIPLARRRSGGGTVFHDLGNLNLTFFTSKKAYDRRRNLKVVTEALRRVRPELDVQATDRFDILLNGHYKISGIQSNATPSVPSPVANLLDHAPTLQWEELLVGLVHQYNTEFGLSSPLTLVNPADESTFPGLSRTAKELRSWDWTFGRTPKFSIQTLLDLTDSQSSAHSSAQLHMEVKNGLIESCELDVPADWLPRQLTSELVNVLVGERFCPHRAAAAAAVLLRSESGEQQTRLHNLCDAVLSVMG